MDAIGIARICHDANRAYCIGIGDYSQLSWDEAPRWQRESAVAGVEAVLSGRARTPEEQHLAWLAQKRADGWTYGPVKDAAAKTHPCCVPYRDLQHDQKIKDVLFRAVVGAITATD